LNGTTQYSIIMVVHNALEMVKISTTRTLQYIDNHDAKLIIVDNASSDGTQEWLKLLSQRGDIQLIQNNSNIGHGPAIEQALNHTQSPYIVTLDSDAFPLSDDWLIKLKSRLNKKAKITGILHHRDYIHPACLMIARKTIEEFKLSFLNEKRRSTKFDVAERMSVEIKRRGYQIAGLKRTNERRRGSVSEPVYLGSTYEGIVYHQWYTTRKEIAGSRKVDDVPSEFIEKSLQELIEEFQNENRRITVIVGISTKSVKSQRFRNAFACLQALNLQDLPRWHYRIIIVEQNITPVLKSSLAPLADHYIFAYNPGAYNRGWTFNIGASIYRNKSDIFCLIDADILTMPNFLSSNLERIEAGQKAVLPYNEIIYLDPESTKKAIADRLRNPLKDFSNNNNYCGHSIKSSQGGCIWVEANTFFKVGGFDERFRGYGREDREFWRRLEKVTPIYKAQTRLLHLDHPSQAIDDSYAMANRKLFQKILRNKSPNSLKSAEQIGNLELYNSEKINVHQEQAGKREWENWHRWKTSRIERIIAEEKRKSIRTSARRLLADILFKFGNSLLDVGCGPGALWLHLTPYKQHFSWMGVDVTREMMYAAHRFFPDVPKCLADSGNLPFTNSSFDIVLLRHILEHLPQWLMEKTLSEAMRVARTVIVIDFYVSPTNSQISHSKRVGENFLETCWTVKEIESPLLKNKWCIQDRYNLNNNKDENNEIWIVMPENQTDVFN